MASIADAKYVLGRSLNDHELQAAMKNWPFKVELDAGVVKMKVTVDGREMKMTPHEVNYLHLRVTLNHHFPY